MLVFAAHRTDTVHQIVVCAADGVADGAGTGIPFVVCAANSVADRAGAAVPFVA